MKVVVYCNFSNVAQSIEMKAGKVLLNNYTSIDMNQLKPYQTLLIYYEL